MQQRTHDKPLPTAVSASLGCSPMSVEGSAGPPEANQRLDFCQPLSQTSLCLAFRLLRSKGLCRCQKPATAAMSNTLNTVSLKLTYHAQMPFAGL